MDKISRRRFLTSAAGSALAMHVSQVNASPLGLPIGSQTWPHRAALRQDFPGVLEQLARIGVQEIEMCSPLGYSDFAALTRGSVRHRSLLL